MAKRFLYLAAFLVAGLQLAYAQPKPFPGAKIDQQATGQAKAAAQTDPGLEVTVYTTDASFEKVCAYYKDLGKEYQMPGRRVRKLPTGQELHDAFFLLDNAADLPSSKLWVKVQRPFIGYAGLAARGSQASDVRDVTAIVVSKRK
jgi:hypothetical protein